MTVAKVWDGAQWVPVVGAQGPPGPPGPAGAGGLLQVQTKNGAAETYSGNFAGNVPQNVVDRTGAGAQAMALIYTPAVNAWWEVSGFFGLVQKMDAAYHYVYRTIALDKPDADGIQAANLAITQHSQVNQFDSSTVTRIFKLVAGTTYTAFMQFSGNGGTWTYYCGPSQLQINSKAWAR